MAGSLGLVRLPANQARSAAEVLARAFHNDPLMQYLMPVEARRTRWLPSLFSIVVRYCLAYGEVYTTPGLDGAGCVLPPSQTHPPFILVEGVRLPSPTAGLRSA